MKLRIIMALILCIACLLCAGACGEKKQAGLKALTLNEVTRSVFYAPLYVAVQNGFFEAEGLSVTVETGGGSDKSMTALLAGEADVALMGPETVVYVANQGKADAPLVVGQLTKRDGSFLVSRADEAEGFEWESMRGKTVIGGRRGGMPLMTLEYVLKQHGMQPGEDVTVIDDVQFNLMAGAFEGGTGDYVTLFEPTATNVQNAGKGHIVANVGLESGEVPYTAFMVTRQMIKNDPATVEAFMRAIYKAQQWVKTASDNEIAVAIEPFFPDTDIASLEIVAKSYRETDSWMSDPVMTEDSYERLLDIIQSAGELDKRPTMESVVDNSFAKKVSKK